MGDNSTVDGYISQYDDEVKNRLRVMRDIVRSEVPDAEEGIMYGLIGYKLHKKPLVYFGGFKNHVGLYATPNGHEAFAHEFASYRRGKGSVQFPNNQPLPVDLITKVVVYRKSQVSSDL